jgi:hypothetical protein
MHNPTKYVLFLLPTSYIRCISALSTSSGSLHQNFIKIYSTIFTINIVCYAVNVQCVMLCLGEILVISYLKVATMPKHVVSK